MADRREFFGRIISGLAVAAIPQGDAPKSVAEAARVVASGPNVTRGITFSMVPPNVPMLTIGHPSGVGFMVVPLELDKP